MKKKINAIASESVNQMNHDQMSMAMALAGNYHSLLHTCYIPTDKLTKTLTCVTPKRLYKSQKT